jgi:predicted glycoside hydrolase/deacetylase ChbG (UPF0249 family)
MKQAVVNADDFGICTETNLAIEIGFRRGILTSASLMPNMPGFAHAVESVLPRCPGLGVGVHLVLTSGRPVADPATVPLLVDARGVLRRNFAGIFALTSGLSTTEALGQIETELAAQFERVRAARVDVDHVNSHQHVHMIPAVWRVVASLASRYGWPVGRLGSKHGGQFVGASRGASGLRGGVLRRVVLAACAVPTRRLTAEQPAPGVVVRHPDRVAAVLDQRGMAAQRLAECLAALPEGVTEIVTHPSLASMSTVASLAGGLSRADVMFLSSPGRRLEFEALKDPQIRSIVQQHGIELTSFGARVRPAQIAACCP